MKPWLAIVPLVLVTACKGADTASPADGSADGSSACTADRDCRLPFPRCDVAGGGRCVVCQPHNDNCLANNRVCARSGPGWACVARCLGDGDCPLADGQRTQSCCDSRCIDVRADPKNCGACGKSCGSKEKCCGGGCTNPMADAANCGGCGMACAVAHASASCAGGRCAPGACNPGWGDCDGQPADGCETDLRVDRMNCGACGTACSLAHAVAACADGCFVAACRFGWDDCDGNAANGCETSLLDDPMNCGGCAMACPPSLPNATPGCSNGACRIASCATGWADCDGSVANGCEALLAGDDQNCGACGKACDAASGLHCRNGSCSAASSCAGWASGSACWYISDLGKSCDVTCTAHGGFDAVAATHTGNPVCSHFFPQKRSDGDWLPIECCSTDSNTNWAANGMPPDSLFSWPFCYLACACKN